MHIDPSTIIGNGGYGFVVVIDEHPKRAAKYLRKNAATQDRTFIKECETLEKLRHPNIIQYFEFKEIGIYNVIEMEFCERNSLSEVLKDPTIVYSMKTVLCWAKHLFEALLCLQRIKILHRDIKPSNVLVKQDFILKLADFGCVLPANAATTASLAGTFRYMSPEAYGYPPKERRSITPLSDLYSVGLVLWEIVERRMVYSQYAFERFKDHALFYDLWNGVYVLEEIDCIDEVLKDLVKRCTNAHPDQRPSIEECFQTIKNRNESTKDERFEPETVERQTKLIRPIGFDGTKDWIPIKDSLEIDLNNLSITMREASTSRKASSQGKEEEKLLIENEKAVQNKDPETTQATKATAVGMEENEKYTQARKKKRVQAWSAIILFLLIPTIALVIWMVVKDSKSTIELPQIVVPSAVARSALKKCSNDEKYACINIYNNCPFTIWPGISGSFVPEGGGFKLHKGESRQFRVPNDWNDARIWARTGCDKNMNCETGDCGGNTEQCDGRKGVPPISLAEFTLGMLLDWYAVSMTDGYNLPILISPIIGTFNTTGEKFDCKTAGRCVESLNSDLCPPNRRVIKDGSIVACRSLCEFMKTDQHCCLGAFGNATACPPDPHNLLFKNACPGAYYYPYDSQLIFKCHGNTTPSAAYTVQFC